VILVAYRVDPCAFKAIEVTNYVRSPVAVSYNRDVNRGLASGEIDFVKTSGSTSESVTNIWNQRWWDASERASWSLNSVAAKVATGHHSGAILANPMNVGVISDTVELSMEKRRLSRFLYLNEKTNPLSWTPEHMDRMIRELEIFIFDVNVDVAARTARDSFSPRPWRSRP
jgi:hypothetical protein